MAKDGHGSLNGLVEMPRDRPLRVFYDNHRKRFYIVDYFGAPQYLDDKRAPPGLSKEATRRWLQKQVVNDKKARRVPAHAYTSTDTVRANKARRGRAPRKRGRNTARALLPVPRFNTGRARRRQSERRRRAEPDVMLVDDPRDRMELRGLEFLDRIAAMRPPPPDGFVDAGVKREGAHRDVGAIVKREVDAALQQARRDQAPPAQPPAQPPAAPDSPPALLPARGPPPSAAAAAAAARAAAANQADVAHMVWMQRHPNASDTMRRAHAALARSRATPKKFARPPPTPIPMDPLDDADDEDDDDEDAPSRGIPADPQPTMARLEERRERQAAFLRGMQGQVEPEGERAKKEEKKEALERVLQRSDLKEEVTKMAVALKVARRTKKLIGIDRDREDRILDEAADLVVNLGRVDPESAVRLETLRRELQLVRPGTPLGEESRRVRPVPLNLPSPQAGGAGSGNDSDGVSPGGTFAIERKVAQEQQARIDSGYMTVGDDDDDEDNPQGGGLPKAMDPEKAAIGSTRAAAYARGVNASNAKLPQPVRDELAMYGDEINKALSKEPLFTGVYTVDKLDDVPLVYPSGWVMNTVPSTAKDQQNGHWVAMYQNGDSIEYFDPLGDPPPMSVIKAMAERVKKQGATTLSKFKHNNVKVQGDDASVCGQWVVHFLRARFNKFPFRVSSGYDLSKKLDPLMEGSAASAFGYL